MFNSATNHLLRKLELAQWFHSVGKKELTNVKYVNSWLHAVAGCVSIEWQNANLEAFNIIGYKVQAKSMQDYQKWNRFIEGIRSPVTELVNQKTEHVVAAHKLPQKFVFSVQADILGAAMETEFSYIVEPGFFSYQIVDCYLKGHFPCGWEGEFPEGTLIVY